jgi:hypothetical protein
MRTKSPVCTRVSALARPFVDPHLTGSNDAVHMGFGHALQVAQQKIVQALTGGFLVHRQGFDRGGGRGGLCVYNDLHQCQVLSA